MTKPADYLRALIVLLLAVGGCLVLRSRLNPTDVAMVLLLADVFVASRYHQGPALLAALLSIVIFDFAFVPPYYTLDASDSAYFLTFGVMLVVALVMSRLTARVREQADAARERELRAAALYELSHELGDVESAAAVLPVLARHLERAAGTAPLLLQADDTGRINTWPAHPIFQNLEVRVAAEWVLTAGEVAGRGTQHCAEAEAMLLPLRTPSRILGVAVVPLRAPDDVPTAAARETLRALAEESSRALERTLLAERHEQGRVEIEAERLRTALLSSLSHDLRSPLGSIEGAASLLHGEDVLASEVRKDLAAAILHESRRMTRLVANLLDMIRVETGTLAVKKAWQPLEEALGVALIRLDERLKSHHVKVALPEDLPLVPIDELLIEQVFINLLENASKYAESGTAIAISAWAEPDAVVVEVADQGPGIPATELEAVFHKFYRMAREERGSGSGLGLTICRGIIGAHGGRIWAEPNPGGGVSFRFTLPLTGPELSQLPMEAAEA
jgi:two-component system sensor histidine kinase KdpD